MKLTLTFHSKLVNSVKKKMNFLLLNNELFYDKNVYAFECLYGIKSIECIVFGVFSF